MEPVETMEVIEIKDDDIIVNSENLAENKKDQGNQQYKLKQYSKAEAFYTEAINLCPQNAPYYGNRAACYMMLNQYESALEDSFKSIQLDPTFVKGWIRVAKCCIALGDVQAATQALDKVRELEPNNSSLPAEMNNLEVLKRFTDEAEKAYSAKDFRKVVYCLDRARDVAVACTKFKVLKAECLARLGRYQESQELANEVLAVDKQNADAILVRGMCLYYQDNDERAFFYFQHVLKLDPDHKKAVEIYKKARALKQKKEEGNEAFKTGKNSEAYKLYTEALNIDPCNTTANAKLYFNRATVQSKLGKLHEAVEDCTEAIKLDPNYLKAILRRAKCYMDLQQFEEAVRDYENAAKMSKCRDVKKLLNDAKLELKKSQRKDYYKILGVEKNATNDDIRKAYRKRALVHHPDRHSHASEGEKKAQEKKFKEVGEAYGILSDPQKRTRYDNGFDIEDAGCGGMPGDYHEAFQTFFSNDGGAFFSQGFPGAGARGFTFHYQ